MPLARRSRSRLLLLIIFGVLGYWYFFTGESRSAVETSVSHLEDGILAKPEPGKFGYKEQPSPDLGAPKKVENIAEPAAKPPAKQAEPLVLAKPAKPKSTPALGKPVIRQDAYMAATILPGPAAAVGAKQPQQQPKVVNGAGHAKAADVATQTLAYYGAIPTALTGKARTNALRLANQAKLAELEAAEALGRATAAKALVTIAAETSMPRLIKQYWKSALIHYNSTVQSLTAKRIRQFLIPPSTPPKTPLCLVAFHEGKNDAFPAHISAFLESVSRNEGYANVHLFVHNVTRGTVPEYAGQGNIRVVDVGHVDRSYRVRGFAGMVADKICGTFGKERPKDLIFGWEDQDEDCALLEERLRAYKGDGTHFLNHLQGHFANIFDSWVGPDVCDSWAWANTDTLVGNLERWLGNKKVLESDVATTHEGDAWRIYLGHSFTVFNWRVQPDLVAGLWKRCENLATLPGILKTFEDPGARLSITEGCFSYGALTTPGLKAVMLPWQYPSWRNPTLVVLYEGHLTYCVGEPSSENCRKWVKGIVKERATREKQAKALQTTGKHEATETYLPNGPSIAEAFGHKPSRVVQMPVRHNLDCSDWLPIDKQICVGRNSTDLPEMQWLKYAYIQSVTVSNTTDPKEGVKGVRVFMEEYELPRDFVSTGTEKGVAEVLVVPEFVRWAGVKGRVPKVERTWFYTIEKGSIQVSVGKVLFHTLQGWW